MIDDAADTITFHLTVPDPDFLDKLALPSAVAVPATAAAVPQHRALPATGPYVIAELRPDRFIRLVRNPHFHVWSSAAKPDGYPDEITVGVGINQSAAVRAVERGTADYVFLAGRIDPAKERNELYTRFAGQIHSNPLPGLVAFFLNTRTAPFDNIDARKAVNYAVDRRAAAAVTSGAGAAAPTCQILPPNFPGYRRYCPYTADPGPGRAWRAPDLERARRLIARSNTRGMHVKVWAPTAGLDNEAGFLVPLLDKLGYRASLRLIPDAKYFTYIADSRRRAQVGAFFLGADYPAARDLLQGFFSCHAFTPDDPNNSNWSEFCDTRTDRLMDRAQRLQATDASAANQLWARADQSLVNQATVLPLDNPTQLDVVSRRVGDYQYSPQYGILLDQLWLH